MINVVELFAGIGAQRMALKKIGINHKVINISEWEIDAIIAYDAIHHGVITKKEIDNLTISEKEIKAVLKKFIFSHDGKNVIKKLPKGEKLKRLFIANKRTNNLGDIKNISAESFNKKIDLLTYSFPCQDLSLQGKQKGLKDGSSSSMLWEVGRILESFESKKLPNILLMENVSNIFNSKHISLFIHWQNKLEKMGYTNYAFKLKGIFFDIPQNRERAFLVSIKNSNHTFKIPDEKKITNLRIKDFLIKNKHDLSTKIKNEKIILKQLSLKKPTSSKIISIDSQFSKFTSENKIYSINSIAPTLTANGAHSRIKIGISGKIRYLSAEEYMLLMGFDSKAYEAQIKSGLTHVKIKKQAGNSIIVNVLCAIFKEIYDK